MSDDNVLKFTGISRCDVPPDQVLSEAIGKCESVIVIGYDKEGDHYFACSMADSAIALWLIEKFKRELLQMGEE